MHPGVVIVIPGDDPPQLRGSPHLERLRRYGEVILHAARPPTAEDQVRRAANAVCLINSRGAVRWPGEVLRRLPRLKMITACGIGTDAIDLDAARELGIAVCRQPVLDRGSPARPPTAPSTRTASSSSSPPEERR
jgi:lactate dehydrogenase-like 2-hydroxyacid dehydrogenase